MQSEISTLRWRPVANWSTFIEPPLLFYKLVLGLTLTSEHKKHIIVMPAWMAGIQVRRMRPETSMSAGFQRSMLE